MIRCIFCDFCQLRMDSSNLIETVIIKHFTSDLIDLSQDRVVNVRLCLAEAFYHLQKTLDRLEIQQLQC